ncbi:MAG: lipoate--protein ligase [Calditrichaeota bacterium]|nr:lipoate--protein ligase [Calditrichota bacterium]RQV98592.1 MAG: lipoate--protein ligase [Calditrichota bacterium]
MKFLFDNRDSTDPALNLALEEYAVRNIDISHDYVLLYVNSPAVVVGRHQNIYEETDILSARRYAVQLMRRISGGGTVYHDPGNINFSFVTRHEKFKFNNYRYFNEPVISALKAIGINAELNGRNNIVVGDYKISGNAQFTSKDRMVSHGTLLFDANLDRLNTILKPGSKEIESRAVKSVPSNVINIRDILKGQWNIAEFKKYLLKHIFDSEKNIPVHKFADEQWEEIYRLAENKYRQWDWIFGESPAFFFRNEISEGDITLTIELEVKKGRITQVKLNGSLMNSIYQKKLSDRLLQCRFDPEEIRTKLGEMSTDPLPLDAWRKLLFA